MSNIYIYIYIYNLFHLFFVVLGLWVQISCLVTLTTVLNNVHCLQQINTYIGVVICVYIYICMYIIR